jgi:hypothetical protein
MYGFIILVYVFFRVVICLLFVVVVFICLCVVVLVLCLLVKLSWFIPPPIPYFFLNDVSLVFLIGFEWLNVLCVSWC